MSSYNPLWILLWHSLQTGICFRLISPIWLRNPLYVIPRFLTCFTWCISISWVDLQMRHPLYRLDFDRVLAFKVKGSLKLVAILHFLVSSLPMSNTGKLIILLLFFSNIPSELSVFSARTLSSLPYFLNILLEDILCLCPRVIAQEVCRRYWR